MGRIDEHPTEAWGYIAVKVNELEDRVAKLELGVPRKKTPAELKEIRRKNMAKARAARG